MRAPVGEAWGTAVLAELILSAALGRGNSRWVSVWLLARDGVLLYLTEYSLC